MSGVQTSIRGIYLQNHAAVDTHRKHDAFKASLYFGVDVLNGHADESCGQVAQKFLEIIGFRVSSDRDWRSSHYDRPAIFCSWEATSHSVWAVLTPACSAPEGAHIVSFLYFRR